ncbi:MAG: hypothetical protein WBN14_07660, partial [Polyangiales bacterium]
KSFDRHVRPRVSKVTIGGTNMYFWEELKQWVEKQRVGPSENGTPAPVTTRSSSRTTEDSSTDPRVRAMLGKLNSKQRESIPRLFPVDEPK